MFKLESKIMRSSKILIVNLQICKLNLQIRKVLYIEIPIAKHAERRSGFLQKMVFGLCKQISLLLTLLSRITSN